MERMERREPHEPKTKAEAIMRAEEALQLAKEKYDFSDPERDKKGSEEIALGEAEDALRYILMAEAFLREHEDLSDEESLLKNEISAYYDRLRSGEHELETAKKQSPDKDDFEIAP